MSCSRTAKYCSTVSSPQALAVIAARIPRAAAQIRGRSARDGAPTRGPGRRRPTGRGASRRGPRRAPPRPPAVLAVDPGEAVQPRRGRPRASRRRRRRRRARTPAAVSTMSWTGRAVEPTDEAVADEGERGGEARDRVAERRHPTPRCALARAWAEEIPRLPRPWAAPPPPIASIRRTTARSAARRSFTATISSAPASGKRPPVRTSELHAHLVAHPGRHVLLEVDPVPREPARHRRFPPGSHPPGTPHAAAAFRMRAALTRIVPFGARASAPSVPGGGRPDRLLLRGEARPVDTGAEAPVEAAVPVPRRRPPGTVPPTPRATGRPRGRSRRPARRPRRSTSPPPDRPSFIHPPQASRLPPAPRGGFPIPALNLRVVPERLHPPAPPPGGRARLSRKPGSRRRHRGETCRIVRGAAPANPARRAPRRRTVHPLARFRAAPRRPREGAQRPRGPGPSPRRGPRCRRGSSPRRRRSPPPRRASGRGRRDRGDRRSPAGRRRGADARISRNAFQKFDPPTSRASAPPSFTAAA